jgi:predicted ATPase
LLTDVEWGGELSSQFAFIHDLHRELLYASIPAGRRAELHRAVAERLEQGYGLDARERAAEIALHCVRGGNALGALEYLRLAAEQALRRSGHREAIIHLDEALRQLKAARRIGPSWRSGARLRSRSGSGTKGAWPGPSTPSPP